MANLTPWLDQKFYLADGITPNAGGKVFTYYPGSSTKKATYVSEAGAANTNPIILNSSGECNLWLATGGYKVINAPANDTDPPMAAIKTWDNINVSGTNGEGSGIVSSIAELRTLAEGAFETVQTLGRNSANDTGAGLYYWDATSVEADNGGSVIAPTISDGTGRWLLLRGMPISVTQFGAAGDGVTNDTDAIQRAVNACYIAGGGTVFFPPGAYAVTSIVFNWLSPITVNFEGSGMHSTKITKFDTSTTPIFDLSSTIGNLAVYSEFSKMWIQGIDNGLYAAPGVRLTMIAYFTMREVELNYCDIAVDNLGALINNFYGCKFHLNRTGVKARKAPANNVYCNAVNFYGCRWTGNRFQGVDWGQGTEIRFYGGDVEGNGTDPGTFTADASTDLLTVPSNIVPTGTAIQFATTTTLPVATMPNSAFTADNTTDRITLSTALNLPNGYPVTVSSSATLPTGLAAATTYYLARYQFSPSVYSLCTTRDNAIAGTPTVINFTTNGTGTLTLTPTGLVVDNDYYWIRVSATTGKVASTLANALAGTALDITSVPAGTFTISYVGTGGILLRSTMNEEIAGSGDGVAHANLSGLHFESNAGRAFATENARGLIVSISDCEILNSQATVNGRAIYINGCAIFIAKRVSDFGTGQVVEICSGASITDLEDCAFTNLSEYSPNPTHYNIADAGGVYFPGWSTNQFIWKNKFLYFFQGSDNNIYHTIGNGGTNDLTFVSAAGLGFLFQGGTLTSKFIATTKLDLADSGGTNGQINLISAANSGTQFAIENQDAGGRRYVISSGGSAGGAYPVGKLTIRDATSGANRMTVDLLEGIEFLHRAQFSSAADVASANDMTLGTGNQFSITGTTPINRILRTSWQAGAFVFLSFAGACVVAHQGAANSATLGRINLQGGINLTTVANTWLVLAYDGTQWWEVCRTSPTPTSMITLKSDTFSNADKTITAGTQYLGQTGAMSASRTVTLPAASAYPRGSQLIIADESGTTTIVNTLVITRAGSDTINGANTLTVGVAAGYDTAILMSDGASKWTVLGKI